MLAMQLGRELVSPMPAQLPVTEVGERDYPTGYVPLRLVPPRFTAPAVGPCVHAAVEVLLHPLGRDADGSAVSLGGPRAPIATLVGHGGCGCGYYPWPTGARRLQRLHHCSGVDDSDAFAAVNTTAELVPSLASAPRGGQPWKARQFVADDLAAGQHFKAAVSYSGNAYC
jgi:hypothetical protein